MNTKRSGFSLLSILFSMSLITHANVNTYVSVEEVKIDDAHKALPEITSQFSELISDFESQLAKQKNSDDLRRITIEVANKLWFEATSYLQLARSFDDRALYWGRLQLAKILRTSPLFYALESMEQSSLMFAFELASRGLNDIRFNKNTDKKILVTGFDPFYLHRNIEQSNPSGIAALQFDGMVIEHQGVSAEVQSLIVPVRFADFDQGMIEIMLTDLIKSKQIDLLTTMSMGRKKFDLERFPGLRRSSVAPGNLGVYTGATSQNPLIPFLNNKPLSGPEFVEFSLPITAMKKAKGVYKINDNGKVQTVENGWFTATAINELQNQTSVNGSGGGYLSNEISYRSILLRNQYDPKLAVGHIHTPKITQWQKNEVTDIVEQIKLMLTLSVPVI